MFFVWWFTFQLLHFHSWTNKPHRGLSIYSKPFTLKGLYDLYSPVQWPYSIATFFQWSFNLRKSFHSPLVAIIHCSNILLWSDRFSLDESWHSPLNWCRNLQSLWPLSSTVVIKHFCRLRFNFSLSAATCFQALTRTLNNTSQIGVNKIHAMEQRKE